MMTGFDRLIMDAHLKNKEYAQACDVWQEALRAQTAGDISESVAEGAERLITYICDAQNHDLACRVMDIQNTHLSYGENKHAERIAKTGLYVMNRMLEPNWAQDDMAVRAWDKTVNHLSGRGKSVRDGFIETGGDVLIKYFLEKNANEAAQTIHMQQEDILLQDQSLSSTQYARTSTRMAMHSPQ